MNRQDKARAAQDLLAGAFGVPVFSVHQDTALASALNAGELPGPTGKAADDLEHLVRWAANKKGE